MRATGGDTALGLTAARARELLAAVGLNELVPRAERPAAFVWASHVLTDPMVLLLIGVAIVYFAVGDGRDGVVSLVALVAIASVSVVLEARAERTLAQLRRLTEPQASVVRDGEAVRIPAREIVPGDLVRVEEGDVVPADGTLDAEAYLKVDESSLTGEWHPLDRLAADPLFAGTTVLSGRGALVVTATGPRTQYGKIGTLVAKVRESPTQLQRGIRRLVVVLAIAAAIGCLGVAILELVRGATLAHALVASVTLAMAAIPEEFPMVFALYLGLGAWRLARDRALMRRLTGIEALGATTVIATDKTGTLTLGSVALGGLADAGGEVVPLGEPARALISRALLACDPEGWDPLDRAIRVFAEERAWPAPPACELVARHPFDPTRRYVSYVWRKGARLETYAKGALETIFAVAAVPDDAQIRALAAHERLAAAGMRVLALAHGPAVGTAGDRGRDEAGLRFGGLVAFADPLRPGVRHALEICREAGIRVIMMTGDHPLTARAIADALGLDARGTMTGDALAAVADEDLPAVIEGVDVFARIDASQKHRLVRALKRSGHVVAVTGDGTNDAPALREADIGIAMGRRGTEVARAAATLVLLDDDFATIVGAVRDGRRIIENLRRAFAYLVAFHMPLLIGAIAIPLAGAPLLLAPVHLVWLELIVHPVSALVFEADPAPADLMRRPPRSAAATVISPRELVRPTLLGLTLTAIVVGTYLVAFDRLGSEQLARTIGLGILIVGQLLLVLALRSPERAVWRASYRANRALPVVLAAAGGSLLLAVFVPLLRENTGLTTLTAAQWGLVLALAAAATLWSEPLKSLSPRAERVSG